MDPDCTFRRASTRSHGLARNPGNGDSGSGSLSCHDRSNVLRFTALAVSPSSSPDVRLSICLHNAATDERGIGPLRLRRLWLADSVTLLHQRLNNSHSCILPSHSARTRDDYSRTRTNRNSVCSLDWRGLVLFATQSSQNTIPIVRRELQELAKTCHP